MLGRRSGCLNRSRRASFPPEPRTVAAVRQFLRDCLRTVDADLVYTATLLASEIAANVVDHAQND